MAVLTLALSYDTLEECNLNYQNSQFWYVLELMDSTHSGNFEIDLA